MVPGAILGSPGHPQKRKTMIFIRELFKIEIDPFPSGCRRDELLDAKLMPQRGQNILEIILYQNYMKNNTTN